MKTSGLRRGIFSLVAVGVAFCALPMQASANATIVIVNNNAAGVGFNDPTPRAPVGGNPGVTLGQQRLNAFQHAADIWGATLDSAVPIRIRAQFASQTCTPTSATLGSAGALYIWSDFPGAQFPGTWYSESLTNKLYGGDANPPGDPADPYNGADINATFNARLGTGIGGGGAGCLGGRDFYLGLDNNHGTNIDLVTVLLHEFGHGLGFQTFTSSSTGAFQSGVPSVYDLFLHDNTTNKDWLDMTAAERAASAINGRNVVWTGVNVKAAAPGVLTLGTPLLKINAPAAIAGIYPVGTADAGPALSSPGLTGDIVSALDDANLAGPSTMDACTAITNPGAVAGKIALVDRGTCGFAVKIANLQNAGAVAMLVADNVNDTPPAGISVGSATIPGVRITKAAGAAIRAQAGVVNGTLGLDMTVLAGADADGRVMINTPSPLVPGSSVSHWDPVATRNLLMEPAINGDLTHSVKAPEDLTLAQMRDIGWYPDQDVDGVPDGTDQCANSVLGGTLAIEGCETGVTNTFFANGCSVQDVVNQCGASAATHEDYTSCVTHFTNALKAGLITNKQKATVQKCAARADIP
jgi:hypothetical protein